MRWQSHIWQLGADRGWTQTRLAHELGVSRVTLWRVRSGLAAPSLDLMVASGRVFMRPPFELWWQETAPSEVAV
jgi:DNA-binding XRE family transcriptional regulator